jgi:hypothetical protein
MSMNGARLIQHKGKQVVLLDFVGIHDPDVGLPLIDAAGRFVQALPADGSALSCTDVTDTQYDRRVVEAFKVMSTGNGPHVKVAAVVTSSSIHRAAISMIALVSRRKIVSFATRTEALDWLVSQP